MEQISLHNNCPFLNRSHFLNWSIMLLLCIFNHFTCLDSRYILKKKFERGAYGEVWLAFNWNCSQVGKSSQRKYVEENGFYRNERTATHDENEDTNKFFEDCKGGNSDDNMFILKRIMVHNQILYLHLLHFYFLDFNVFICLL